MRKLNRIVLINSAGFHYLEFPVGGHTQVIGVNGHGKSTLLRTVLFFYLGNNDKASYALHETKADFVSHYLGDPPSYLIYEVARQDGQPAYHIAVSRPAGRIQFLFVDAPFQKHYYVDGKFVQPINSVEQRLQLANCSVETVGSYEDFNRRIYGIIPSPFSVFKPAAKTSGQVGVLSRIISGIFTVSQLDADKLKTALTCGVRQDALTTELDLLSLKGQLENFRRVNQAVKTYLQHESEALRLVDTAEEFEDIKIQRNRAIEELVRGAKLLPDKAKQVKTEQDRLKNELDALDAQHAKERNEFDERILKLGQVIAHVGKEIEKGEKKREEYGERQIDFKAAELEKLPKLLEKKALAESEYNILTGKFQDQREQKNRLLGEVQRSWTELRRHLEEQKGQAERHLSDALQELSREEVSAYASLDQEAKRVKATHESRRSSLQEAWNQLNADYRRLGEMKEPSELVNDRNDLSERKLLDGIERYNQQEHRAAIASEKQRYEHSREVLEKSAETERANLQARIKEVERLRERAAVELEQFDESLARFFQMESPATWPYAAKTFTREALFHSAEELKARRSEAGVDSAWGVEFSTDKLPQTGSSFDRDALEANVQQTQKELRGVNDQFLAAQERYFSKVSELEKQTNEALKILQSKLDSSNDLSRLLLKDILHLENRILTLQSQFESHNDNEKKELNKRSTELDSADKDLRKDLHAFEVEIQSRKTRIAEDIHLRKDKLLINRASRLSELGKEYGEATSHRDREIARIEDLFQKSLTQVGISAERIEAAQNCAKSTDSEINKIESYRTEVTNYQQVKRDFIDPLSALRSQHRLAIESLQSEETKRDAVKKRYCENSQLLKDRQNDVKKIGENLDVDVQAANRFKKDLRFVQELGFFDREDIGVAPFYRPGAVKEFLEAAESSHETHSSIGKRGDKETRAFLNYFDDETLKRKVLGFSPIHPYFDWFIFVGSELRPFVNGRGIQGMKQIQTQEFEQLIRNVCARNADFQEGIRQVKKTAALVEKNLKENNFVDVLDSIELKVERVDSKLTQILTSLEEFSGLTFGGELGLFDKRADRQQIDKAIEAFESLLREIENHRSKRLQLTDYFDFFIRVHENGHDMGWRKSLDHIGSTGTDYLVKMLIYLSLVEVYREKAINSKEGSIVHCVMDETGVLAVKYIRSILEYAKSRGIILITAGHSQQTLGFENWLRVSKRGQRFGGQTVLRKVLKCE